MQFFCRRSGFPHDPCIISRDIADINCKMICSSTKRHYTNAILLPNIPNGKAHKIYLKKTQE